LLVTRERAGAERVNLDIVLEGGGVKAVAQVGTATVLEERGYRIQRAAGSSAGAVVAAGLAAGVPAARLKQLMDSLDYRRVPDATGVARLGLLGRGASLLFEQGVYDGDYLRGWIHDALKREAGVETFGDLRLPADPDDDLRPNQRYRLVVIAADVSRGQLVRLPWDYEQYGLDPDRQLIADAVRASTSIAFFFKPVHLAWAKPADNVSVLVDGGVVSDFPIEIFDRTDGRQPRWPTFGVTLSARTPPGALRNRVGDSLSLALAILDTTVSGNDRVHLADPCVASRTIFVDTLGVSAEDFDIDVSTRQALYENGRSAAERFLTMWDWDAYLRTCGIDPGRVAKARAARGELDAD
jgi:NTE family protein